MKHVTDFFKYAEKRQRVLQRKRNGAMPLTTDLILANYRFCNVFREDDRTTQWFRENVRDPLRNDPRVLLATTAFRWINRIETGEAMLNAGLFHNWDVNLCKEVLASIDGPVITAAYIVNTPPGKTKIEALPEMIDNVAQDAHRIVSEIRPGETTMEELHARLTLYPRLGNFIAYEIVTDLRFTFLLDDAPDILTWASPGPGAARGLARIDGVPFEGYTPPGYAYGRKLDRIRMIEAMRKILKLSRVRRYWDPLWSDGREWEMREVEHTLCEFDKYERARTGQGRPKQQYRPHNGE